MTETISPPTTELIVMGGSYQIDRAMKGLGDIADLITENEGDLLDGVVSLFAELVIVGDSAGNSGQFDGLNVALAGEETEVNATDFLDLSTAAAVDQNAKLFEDMMDEWLATAKRQWDVIYVPSKLYPKMSAVARRVGAATRTTNDLGKTIDNWNGIPFVDMGMRGGSTNPIIPIESRTVGGGTVTGLTDMYGMCFGPQEFHGVAPNNGALINMWEPDFTRSEAQQEGGGHVRSFVEG